MAKCLLSDAQISTNYTFANSVDHARCRSPFVIIMSGPKIPQELHVCYLPQDPKTYRPGIGLIGCGGITGHHLGAYRDAGYHVVALCDIDLERARDRQKAFFPHANLFSDYRDLLNLETIEVVDIATHTDVRTPIIEAAVIAGKHVLSQKPFVTDLDEGLQLVELAERQNVKLAVNQNARWAPHFSYIRGAIASGLLGELVSAHCSVHWDHTWVKGTAFENMRDLILFDYAIHWFDFLCAIFSQPPRSVYSSVAVAASQPVAPALLAQSRIEYDHAQASLVFDGCVPFGVQDRTYVAGALGSINSTGPGNSQQQLSITTSNGEFHPALVGKWFSDGFHGTMGELLCSIEENRSCSINARDNLKCLELCFAAVASSQTRQPVRVGSVRQLPA